MCLVIQITSSTVTIRQRLCPYIGYRSNCRLGDEDRKENWAAC